MVVPPLEFSTVVVVSEPPLTMGRSTSPSAVVCEVVKAVSRVPGAEVRRLAFQNMATIKTRKTSNPTAPALSMAPSGLRGEGFGESVVEAESCSCVSGGGWLNVLILEFGRERNVIRVRCKAPRFGILELSSSSSAR